MDTGSIQKTIEEIAQENDTDPTTAWSLYCQWEDRLRYGEEFIPFKDLLRKILAYMDMELKTDAFCASWDKLNAAFRNMKPFEDTVPCLKRLKEDGWKIVLLSNSCHDYLAHHIQKMEGLADDYLCADDVQAYKPQLEFFRKAQKRLDLKEKHIHAAKGYWWDMVPAQKMGWKRIWINRNNETAPFGDEPDQRSLADLPKKLR